MIDEDIAKLRSYINFFSADLQYRQKSLHHHSQELLAKAIGHKTGKQLKILDATAGFGVDAFLLANLGHDVTMIERSPLIASFLKEAIHELFLQSAYQHLKLKLIHDNAINFMMQKKANNVIHQTEQYEQLLGQSEQTKQTELSSNIEQYDVIYLDPMYPERNKTALNKQKMRLLKEVVGTDDDAEELFNVAKCIAKNRVVVKRPRLAKLINLSTSDNKKYAPTFVIHGKSCRYDVYQIVYSKVV